MNGNMKNIIRQYEIAEISIRGRMGYAITCIEKIIKFYKAQTPQIDKLLFFLWEYTLSIRLDLWEEEFIQMVPESVNDFIKRFDLQFLEDDTCSFIFDILKEVYEVATGNLHGGYRSTYTETPLVQIVEKMDSKNIILPAIAPFSISKVSEEHGWGRPIAKSDFLAEIQSCL